MEFEDEYRVQETRERVTLRNKEVRRDRLMTGLKTQEEILFKKFPEQLLCRANREESKRISVRGGQIPLVSSFSSY